MLKQTDSASREGRSQSGLRPLCPEPVQCSSGEVSSPRTSQWCSQCWKMTGMSPMGSFPFLIKATAMRKDKWGCVVLPRPRLSSRDAVRKEAHLVPFLVLATLLHVSFSCFFLPSAVEVPLTIPIHRASRLTHAHTRTTMKP